MAWFKQGPGAVLLRGAAHLEASNDFVHFSAYALHQVQRIFSVVLVKVQL
jgi:hypothetical protein